MHEIILFSYMIQEKKRLLPSSGAAFSNYILCVIANAIYPVKRISSRAMIFYCFLIFR